MQDLPLGVIENDAPGAGTVERELRRLVSGEVRFGRHDRMLYATDASLYQVEPIGIVVPRSAEEALRVVAWCGGHGVPILPRGGGTSLAGQAVNRAVVLDFSVHCRGLTLDAAQRRATVEPGVVLDDLNREAATHGLTFAPDVASGAQATLGGMIGNDSAGAHSILYGRTVEHLDGVDLVLADGRRLRLEEGAADRDPDVAAITRRVAEVVAPMAGEVRRRYPKTLRRVNGYNLDLVLDDLERSAPGRHDRVNLARLVCGAEGTLGAVVEARVRLVETPRHKGLAILAFRVVDEALSVLTGVLATRPAAVELIDDMIIELALGNVECRGHVELLPGLEGARPGAVLYVEYFAVEPDELPGRFDALAAAVPAAPMSRITDAAAMGRAWALRRSGEPLLHGIHGPRKPLTFIEDTAVDPARLAEFVRDFRRIVAAHGTRAVFYAHASVGCLHIRPLVDLRAARDREAMVAMAGEVTDLVSRYGGALSGEHGDGRARSHLLERFFGPVIVEALARVKAIFDPQGLFNPGIIVNGPPMTASLRVSPHGPLVDAPDVRTHYAYGSQGGFAEAVGACNGAGVCRRTSGGTMCPSYRALRDERHATRGRANALRLAITGQFSGDGRPAWDDPDTVATLDLCLGCKACKAECPSNVDVAKLKSEYTAQRFDRTGTPWRARLLSDVRRANRIGSALWPLADALRSGPVAAAARGILGIDRRRSLPRFGTSLYRWFGRRRRPAPRPGAPVIIYFPDCFTVYGEPQVGRAAIRVLEALGYRVELPRLGCCGRAQISTGLLREAARTCARTAGELLGCMERAGAEAVVAGEPGCLSAIVDDWLDLRLGIEPSRLRGLAARTFLVEQLVEERWGRHPAGEPASAPAGTERVLLHGHCHQKALLGIESSAGLLRRLAGDRLVVLDSGCCGMAGSFGYAPQHFDLSAAIGEMVLFPAIRAEPDALVVAPGTSCRHQVLDFTGRRAVHPIELAERLLVS